MAETLSHARVSTTAVAFAPTLYTTIIAVLSRRVSNDADYAAACTTAHTEAAREVTAMLRMEPCRFPVDFTVVPRLLAFAVIPGEIDRLHGITIALARIATAIYRKERWEHVTPSLPVGTRDTYQSQCLVAQLAVKCIECATARARDILGMCVVRSARL